MRRTVFLSSAALLALIVSSMPVSACEHCEFYGISCTGYDNCEPIYACEPSSGPSGNLDYSQCSVWWGSCYTGGELCRWASNPSTESDFLLLRPAQASRRICTS